MKISCSKELLTHAVQTVQKAVASKSTLPILTGIYLSALDGKLELQATDYEIGICCKIDAQIDEPGTIVLSGRYLQELVRKLPGDTIHILSLPAEKTIQITSNSAQFNLLLMPAEEFPVINKLEGETSFLIKDNVFRELIKKTVFACATDEARPIFTGALLEINRFNAKMVATNTHRLALKEDSLENSEKEVKIIIPSKILTELARLLVSEHPLDVVVSCHKNQVSFSFDNVYIKSRVIEGQFPDYNRVIPDSFATQVTLPTDNFLDAVERVSLLARDGEYNVIKLSFENDMVIINSNNPDVGKACETVPAVIAGNGLEIAFNAKYVTDIMKNINSEKITFSFNTPLSPACIKPVDDEHYTYIITPVRTS